MDSQAKGMSSSSGSNPGYGSTSDDRWNRTGWEAHYGSQELNQVEHNGVVTGASSRGRRTRNSESASEDRRMDERR